MLILTLFAQWINPSLRLIFFAPFLVIVYYQKSYVSALNYSFLSGLIIDIFTSPTRFGLTALNYTVTSALIYNQKKNFFADNLMTLPLMTFLFSIISSVIGIILLSIFSKSINFSYFFIFSDLTLMPAFDALFSLCWFILPSLFFGKNNRQSNNYGA